MTCVNSVPRWLLLLALVFAPWAYGSTRPWAVEVLNLLLAVILAAWLVTCLLRRSWPAVPRLLVGTAVWLLAQGAWMILNAKFDYAPAPQTVLGFDYAQRFGLAPLVDAAPGSYHQAFSLPAVIQAGLLLGILCFTCDLVRRSEWRRRLLWTMAGTGVSLVILGLAQRFTDASSIFWLKANLGKTFFATYRYHANAGAYLNLIWPLIAGLLVGTFETVGQTRRKYLWGAAGILCLAGLFVNTSRASAMLAVALLGVWSVWLVKQVWRERIEGISPGAAVVTLGLLVLLTMGVAFFAGLENSLRRWSHFTELITADNPRWLAAGVCWRMLPEAGWWGFGPGTFSTMFPYYTNYLGDTLAGVWFYAHEDYLQTLIEWGYLGGLAWAVVLLGGVITSWRQFHKLREDLSLRKRALHFGMVTAIAGVLLHALVDFPLQVASIQLYVAVLIGMLWGAPAWLVIRRHHHRTREAADEGNATAEQPSTHARPLAA